MRYATGVPLIPTAAISTNAADLLSKSLKDNPSLTFYFKQNCESLPDAKSYNVVGEIKGSEKPDEIIVVGATSIRGIWPKVPMTTVRAAYNPSRCCGS